VIQKAVTVLALLWPLAAASASISEIRKDFLNETSLLPAKRPSTSPAGETWTFLAPRNTSQTRPATHLPV